MDFHIALFSPRQQIQYFPNTIAFYQRVSFLALLDSFRVQRSVSFLALPDTFGSA